MLIHVVQRGETLWQVANQYRVNINEVVRLNELPNPNQPPVGLALLIPVQRQRSHMSDLEKH